MVYRMELLSSSCGECTIALAGRLDAGGGLNVDLLLGAFKNALGREFTFAVHRDAIYSTDERKTK